MTQKIEYSPIPKEQFRMSRLQVFNWGTFSGLHDIPIAKRGFLFIGHSGTGKSTLLDAFSTLLIPPRWIDFNAAAREADRSNRDRSLITYVRGAWGEQKDDESGEIITRYLRSGTTWSCLALTFKNNRGQTIVLTQIFWIRGNSSANSDTKRYYFIFEGDFNLNELEIFSQNNFDLRKLKQKFPSAHSYEEFRPYCERFRHLLGIESDMALRLLHRTQSAKNLGDLNLFLREFMLDKPETFEVAKRLVEEFGDLNAAHQAVITAREQIKTLLPAYEEYEKMQQFQLKQNEIIEIAFGIDAYTDILRIKLLKKGIASIDERLSTFQAELKHQEELTQNHRAHLRDLERQHFETGGDKIEQWELEKRSLEIQKEERLRKLEQVSHACKILGWSTPSSPSEFSERTLQSRNEVEAWQQQNESTRELQYSLANKKKEGEAEFLTANKEIKMLRSQPSNIPAEMLELRHLIATAIRINEAKLPFVGELIEVKKNELEWQGAIERVLQGFALSILITEEHYLSFSQYVNNNNLGRKLVYYRTGSGSVLKNNFSNNIPINEHLSKNPVSTNSLIFKIDLKTSEHTEWLLNELRLRFDYICVDSVQGFRNYERAFTREGQIKHNRHRHEKDDRFAITDRRKWVLGFDNREKLALFEKQAQKLAEEISQLGDKISALEEQERKLRTNVIHYHTIANLEWQDIDAVTPMSRIDAINKQLRNIREGDPILQKIYEQLEKQKKVVREFENAVVRIKVDHDTSVHEKKVSEDKLAAILQHPIPPLTPFQIQNLDMRFEQISKNIEFDNINKTEKEVSKRMSSEGDELKQKIYQCERIIENRFSEFKRLWPMEASDVDVSLESANDYFSKLKRLQNDGLPEHEQNFFDLLQDQSDQNLAALSTHLNQARKDILERMEIVNKSLCKVPFNKTQDKCTYLSIEVSDRQLIEVKEFRQEIQLALSHAWSEDRTINEVRFNMLKSLVDKLNSQDPIFKRWRDTVLDVRLHVEFIGRETEDSGLEVEIYRSGAGKSGGQRQKLATTCLAAALRYQLGGEDGGMPIYSPVILDEAFDKADNDFTALAMNIFTNFGFQMVVATPLKSVMTLEPFIGGACFVNIRERCDSSITLIDWDSEQERLNLPQQYAGPSHQPLHASENVTIELS